MAVSKNKLSKNLLELTPAGLYCPAGDFHIDPSRPVQRAIITHGHSDHARPGSSEYFCTHSSVPLLRHRLTKSARIRGVPYGEVLGFGDALVSFHPAGHILGSAQVRVEVGGEVWVVSGDFKRDEDPTCEPFEVVSCDTFITEATFGLPIYRWPDMRDVAREMVRWWEQGAREGLASVICCYSLGKTQRILGELAREELGFSKDRAVYLHPSAMALTDAYRDQGVRLAAYRSIEDLPDIRKLAGELVLAPPSTLSSAAFRRLGALQTAFASGWMLLKSGRVGRGGYDRGFVVSDHADWPMLVQTARETRARRVLVTHGQDETLSRYLREQGIHSEALDEALS